LRNNRRSLSEFRQHDVVKTFNDYTAKKSTKVTSRSYGGTRK
jgi:hypothetical protein